MNRIGKKILKSRFTSYAIAAIAWLYLKLLFLTCRLTSNIDENAKKVLELKKPCIILAWHGRMFIAPEFMRRFGSFSAVISTHSDGDHLSKFVKMFGHKCIRGSSNKDGFSALMELIRTIKEKISVVITPDGPRGPRFKIGSDVISIAKKVDVPILTFSYSATKAKIFNTWDRFILPLPFSHIFVTINIPSSDFIQTTESLDSFMINSMKEVDKTVDLKMEY